MPFALASAPSLGIETIRQILDRESISAVVRYFSLDFAELTSLKLYESIATYFPALECLTGEWIFSRCLDPNISMESDQRYIEEVLRPALRKTTADVAEFEKPR